MNTDELGEFGSEFNCHMLYFALFHTYKMVIFPVRFNTG
jgi:hypothetical protein